MVHNEYAGWLLNEMARLSLKPDSSFFRKIAVGVVGTRAVSRDLTAQGHDIRELERGALDTKIWKDVKRKRVRIPDLVCLRCGLRFESRAKTAPKLSMSHSDEGERAWDYGMVDSDTVAFPICEPVDEAHWSVGKLGDAVSYWHERNWVRWRAWPHVNYLRTGDLRRSPFRRERPKGVTEGAEVTISWPAVFSTVEGVVEELGGGRLGIRPSSGRRRSLRTGDLRPVVGLNDVVRRGQVVASAAAPLRAVKCPGALPHKHLEALLQSRERTQRFTGVRLARLSDHREYEQVIRDLERDAEEDVYVRLEAASFLTGTCGSDAGALFSPYLEGADEQVRLEAVIALGEAGTEQAEAVLGALLEDRSRAYYLRSAAAWSLGKVGGTAAMQRLVRAFGALDRSIREEALEALANTGAEATPILLAALTDVDESIAAGCAEALRRRGLAKQDVMEAARQLRSSRPSKWAVWLLGNLPREVVAPVISSFQDEIPHLHYALTLLWSFAENWVARRWELLPHAEYCDEP